MTDIKNMQVAQYLPYLCVTHDPVVGAERFLEHWHCLMVLVEGLLKLPLLLKHTCDIHLRLGRLQVVGAKDLQVDIKGLLVHRQGFLWLTLVKQHVSDAAQTQSRAHKS